MHNYAPWVAIAADLVPHDTMVALLPTYYGSERSKDREALKNEVTVTNKKGRTVKVGIEKKDGDKFEARIVVT